MDIAPASQHRLTAPRLMAVSIAPGDRDAGLVTVVDGAGSRLHAWDVPTGTTRPIAGPPAAHLVDLTAPVLIRQAKNDTRAPARQMVAYEQLARDLGKPVTVQWGDGGHGPQGDQFAFERLSLEFAADCAHRASTRP